MADITATFTFANQTAQSFTCAASSGPATVPKSALIAPGGGAVSLTVSDTKDFTGTLRVHKGDLSSGDFFEIDYGVTEEGVFGFDGVYFNKLHFSTPDGYAFGPEGRGDGNSSPATKNVIYDGVAQATGSTTMIMSLTDDPAARAVQVPRLFTNFANAMFRPPVRDGAVIAAAAPGVTDDAGVAVYYADMCGGQLGALIDMWTNHWIDGTACNAPDARLIDVFKGFLTGPATPPDLWVPQLVYDRIVDPDTGKPADSGPAAFKLKGYVRHGFYKAPVAGQVGNVWSEDTVRAFLTLIASGGHIVSICATNDLQVALGKHYSYDAKTDFLAYFNGRTDIARNPDQGSSHYTGTWNSSGFYYLVIASETAPLTITYDPGASPANLGAMVAFMTAKTCENGAPGDYNAFMQLEGWPAHGGLTGGDPIHGGVRHYGDYTTFNDTVWNLSTYGASPYSEKRGTATFLAPHGWTPEVTTVTCMMPYVGAYAASATSAQGWLKEHLVEIDATATPYDKKKYPYA